MSNMNAILLESINNGAFWDGKSEAQKVELLDALLTADISNPEKFRERVANQEMLKVIFAPGAEVWQEKGGAADFFTTNDFLDPESEPSFAQIQQAAAARLVDTIRIFIQKFTPTNDDDAAKIRAIDAARNLVAFKQEVLKVIDSKFEQLLTHLTLQDMTDLQKTARWRRMEIQIALSSRLGNGAHSELFNRFEKLSPIQQRAFLENYKNLWSLLNAVDVRTVKHYLKGLDFGELDSFVAENKRNSVLKSIHNSEVAKIVANIKPPVSLDMVQVDKINKAFSANTEQFNASTYINLVTFIQSQCDLNTEPQLFYKAFGLSEDGANIDNANILSEINKQHSFNKNLLNKTRVDSSKIVDLLLRIEKHALINTFEKDKVQEAMKKSMDLPTFLDELGRDKLLPILTDKRKLLGALTSELTPELFREIKKDVRREQLLNGTAEEVNAVVKNAQLKLREIQKTHLSFAKFQKKVEFIPEIQDIHVQSPLFHNKAPKMKEKYIELAEQSGVIREQLHRDRATLQDYLDSIPVSSHAKNTRSMVEKLNLNLETALTKIDEQLDFYEEIENRLVGKGGVIEAIDAIKAGKQYYTYQVSGVSTYIVNRDTLSKTISETKAEEIKTTVDDLPEGKIAEFLLEDKPVESQVRCFDIIHRTNPTDAHPVVKTAARFIHDPSHGEKQAKVNLQGKYEIHQFPQQIEPEGKPDEQALKEAKVNFSMVMATQILASMDKPPTKEKPLRLRGVNAEELKYLWTALVILGENNSKMSFNSDALRVSSKAFDPASQKSFFGFAKDSLYNTAFKKCRKELVEDKLNALEQQSKERFDAKGAQIREQKTNHATQFFKDRLQGTKDRVDKTREEEGPAPLPPNRSR